MNQRRKWSIKHERCIECARTEVRHVAHGLCVACHGRQLYHNSPNRKKQIADALRRWKNKNKNKNKK